MANNDLTTGVVQRDTNDDMVHFSVLQTLINTHFCPPFVSEGHVAAGYDARSGRFRLRIGPREIIWDPNGELTSAGTDVEKLQDCSICGEPVNLDEPHLSIALNMEHNAAECDDEGTPEVEVTDSTEVGVMHAKCIGEMRA